MASLIWAHDADANLMTIFSRKTGEPLCHAYGIEFRTATMIAKAVECIYTEGVQAGKTLVINEVNRATDAITV